MSKISAYVLIESDWNLKWDIAKVWEDKKQCINRIRLEFKAVSVRGMFWPAATY